MVAKILHARYFYTIEATHKMTKLVIWIPIIFFSKTEAERYIDNGQKQFRDGTMRTLT